MFSVSRTCSRTSKSLVKVVLRRYLNTIYKKELTVTPFCKLNIKLPYSVKLTPLDIHKYINHDKIIIKLESKSTHLSSSLKCKCKNDTVDISCNPKEYAPDITCNIEAPIKSTVSVTTEYGDVALSNFNGESITLTTDSGNISASKCHCEKIRISSTSGNIICKSVMQAANIYLKTSQRGTITTGRLQGLELNAETESGDIQTESSYCNDSTFTTTTGCLDLHNAHKNCKVVITEKGILNMTGFDGILQAIIKEGDAVVQIARVEKDSKISITDNGTLRLKLFGTCLDYAKFKVNAKNVHIDDNINIKASIKDGCMILNPNKQSTINVVIDCRKSDVIIQGASLLELFNLKLPS